MVKGSNRMIAPDIVSVDKRQLRILDSHAKLSARVLVALCDDVS